MIKDPLSEQELYKLADIGGFGLKDLVNTKSQAFKKTKPDLAAMTDQQVLELIKSDPRILRRPIIEDRKGLLLGFAETVYQEQLG